MDWPTDKTCGLDRAGLACARQVHAEARPYVVRAILESVSPAFMATARGMDLACRVVMREGSTRVMPGARRAGSGRCGFAAISSSQRVPRPRCRRERVQSESPGRTTTVFGATTGAERGTVETSGRAAYPKFGAGKFGCAEDRGTFGRTATTGGMGCRRREKGSTRCTGAEESGGAETIGAAFTRAEGFFRPKFFAGGCGW